MNPYPPAHLAGHNHDEQPHEALHVQRLHRQPGQAGLGARRGRARGRRRPALRAGGRGPRSRQLPEGDVGVDAAEDGLAPADVAAEGGAGSADE